MSTEVFEYDVFLSFSSRDQDLVRPLWQELSLGGLRVFWSDSSLRDRVGTSWFELIQDSLTKSRHLVVVFTPAALQSNWVKREYVAFFNHYYHSPTRRLIPLLADGSQYSDLPLFLRELEACRLEEPDTTRRLLQLLGGVDVEGLRLELAETKQELAHLTAERDELQTRVVEMERRLESEANRLGAAIAERDQLTRDWTASQAEIVQITAARDALLSRSSATAEGEREVPGPSKAPMSLSLTRLLMLALIVALVALGSIGLASGADYGLNAGPIISLTVMLVSGLLFSWRRQPSAYAVMLVVATVVAGVLIWSGFHVITVPDSGPLRSLGYGAYLWRTACELLSAGAVLFLLMSRQTREYYGIGPVARAAPAPVVR